MRKSLYDFCMEQGLEYLLKQWDTERNAPLTPQTVTAGSSDKRIWWRCEKGHAWQSAVYSRAKVGTGCPYCAGKRPVPGETDLAACFPEIAAQWHPTKNAPLTPDQVLPGSHNMAWWVCKKGHEWRAAVKSRVSGCGCPVCTGRKVVPGENDLASQYPLLMKEWHPTKNGALRPQDLTSGTYRKVWWRCQYGHEWKASVASRTRSGSGCPYCVGKRVVSGETDLLTRYPLIAAQWHPDRNGKLLPSQVSAYSNRKVWWRCPLGHDYQAMVGSRTNQGSGCPVCAGRKVLRGFNDLATVEPQVAAQWHPSLNGTLTPDMIVSRSHRKVWWSCPEGHVWKATVYSRTGAQKCGCPVCAGKVRRPKKFTWPRVAEKRL